MFFKSRIVAVDDKDYHLTGLKNALNSLCMDCHTILYDEETITEAPNLPGTRILFLDLNLRTGTTFNGLGSSGLTAISEVLKQLIDPDSGPYGLIIWAEQPLLEDISNFLIERLTGEDAKYLPVFFTALTKGNYINTINGEVINADRLKTDIEAAIASNPQMKALFSWEADVVAAMDATLNSLINLVPTEIQCTTEFPNELGKILYRISQAGSGMERAMENPRESINRVLVPILSDRITQHDPQGASTTNWNAALVNPGTAPITIEAKAQINSAIHISENIAELDTEISATDLGSFVPLPFELNDENLQNKFGITTQNLRSKDFLNVSNDNEWDNCQLGLVQVGASCDHAQPNDGPLLYLLAIEWPFTNPSEVEGTPNLRANKTNKNISEWRTPPLLVEPEKIPGKISVFLNLSMSVTRDIAEGWTPQFRFRDELVSQLTQAYARHISRPGIVELR